MNTFWHNLPKPFLAMAPMEEVTDSVFRQIVAKCCAPDVYFTEFINVDGLQSVGRDAIIHRLTYTPVEQPLIAQVWGMVPENFYKAAKEFTSMGFAGIDINMGCPQRKIVRTGACAALMKNRALTSEIIIATQEGAGELPVSVKTRIGYGQIITKDWIGFLLQHSLDALTIHGRTAAEESRVPNHWDEIARAVELRNALSPQTIMIGNGDVVDAVDALQKAQEFGVDGVMIGRGIFHNLWAFDRSGTKPNKTLSEMLDLLLTHARLFKATWGDRKNFLILRRFFKIYVQGFPGASDLRVELMKTKSLEEVEELLSNWL